MITDHSQKLLRLANTLATFGTAFYRAEVDTPMPIFTGVLESAAYDVYQGGRY